MDHTQKTFDWAPLGILQIDTLDLKRDAWNVILNTREELTCILGTGIGTGTAKNFSLIDYNSKKTIAII